jgi:hypothetical protein
MLKEITPRFIDELCARHDADGGTAINEKIFKVFECFPDNTCPYDVKIKVAVVNTLYNTAIRYIDPVVKSVNTVFSRLRNGDLIINNSIELVDLIATTSWKSDRSGVSHKRMNLSFASKFMHFHSERTIPIYDSYVWIVMTGYLHRIGEYVPVGNPVHYSDFHDRFVFFMKTFNLTEYSAYEIDKFLWQYGKQLITDIQSELKADIEKAKRELRRRLFTA